MKRIIYVLGMMLIFSACTSRESTDQPDMQQNDIPVKILRINKDSIAQVFNSSGYFTTDNETPLSFKNGGVIERIYVKEGDAVHVGQVLAQVQMTEIQSMATQAELGYEKALRDYERAKNLYKDSVATLEQMQNAQTALELAEQQKASVAYNVGESTIRARIGGYVLETFAKEGQVVGPGMPVILVSGGVKDHWVFKTAVSDAQWALVNEGDSARIETDMDENVHLHASVLNKSRSVDRESGGFTLQLAVMNKEKLDLATGLFGKAKIYPSTKETGWRLPYEAVMEGDGNKAYVFAVREDSIAQKVPVIVSRIESGSVIVKSGLENVEHIIVSGNAYLKDGSTIKIGEE